MQYRNFLLGEYDFREINDWRHDFEVEAIFMHESYDRKIYKNDVALIKLKEKATFNEMIWPICLPPSNIQLENQIAYVTGIFLLLFYYSTHLRNFIF